jgi:hypothetical protein
VRLKDDFEPDSAAEQNLCGMLDALEAGILELREERDQLRSKLEELRFEGPVRSISRRKSTRRKSGRKSRKKPRGSLKQSARSRKVDSIQEKPGDSAGQTAPNPQEPTNEPNEKAQRKTRNALGRTLSQLRAIRDSGRSQ